MFFASLCCAAGSDAGAWGSREHVYHVVTRVSLKQGEQTFLTRLRLVEHGHTVRGATFYELTVDRNSMTDHMGFRHALEGKYDMRRHPFFFEQAHGLIPPSVPTVPRLSFAVRCRRRVARWSACCITTARRRISLALSAPSSPLTIGC